MMTRSDRDSVQVQHCADVVRVQSFDDEGKNRSLLPRCPDELEARESVEEAVADRDLRTP